MKTTVDKVLRRKYSMSKLDHFKYSLDVYSSKNNNRKIYHKIKLYSVKLDWTSINHQWTIFSAGQLYKKVKVKTSIEETCLADLQIFNVWLDVWHARRANGASSTGICNLLWTVGLLNNIHGRTVEQPKCNIPSTCWLH